MQRHCFSLVAIVGFAALVCGPPTALAQSLGSAESYAVLGGSSVSVGGGGATVTGDVGVSPGTSITGPLTVVSPFTTHNNDASAIAAQSSTTALYTTLAGMGPGTTLVAELGGTTLTPGIYSFTSTANIAAGTTLTLNGSGTYIFKVGSAITANVGSSVVLTGGASACNVFWQVTSAATLNGDSFAGTVVAQAAVTLGVGADLTGRALTTALGAVTLSGSNTVGGCSTAACPADHARSGRAAQRHGGHGLQPADHGERWNRPLRLHGADGHPSRGPHPVVGWPALGDADRGRLLHGHHTRD